MKYIPILFSGEMVRAILAGTKTQTRRIVKGIPLEWLEDSGFTPDFVADKDNELCPHGHPEDIMWVRETFCNTSNVNSIEDWPGRPHFRTDGHEDRIMNSAFIYRADGEWSWCDDDGFSTERSFWKPSIFMPKAACRIFNKIKNVRIERLHEISEDDAIAEGVLRDIELPIENFQTKMLYEDYTGKTAGCEDARSSYMTLWIAINGEESWKSNPWVWVVEFENTEKPADFV